MKILIDSDQPEANGIRLTLERDGYQVDVASNETKDINDKSVYDFVLSDAKSKTKSVLRNGNIELDTSKHTLKRNKKTVRVTPLEFKVIEFFMRHQGEIIQKSELAKECWPQKQNVTNNTIEVYVKRIRGKLGASSIRTIHSIGYQMDKKLKIA